MPKQFTKKQTKDLLNAAYNKDKLEKYVTKNKLNPTDVYNYGVEVYNKHIDKDVLKRKGMAVADNIRDLKEAKEVQDAEDEYMDYLTRDEHRGGNKTRGGKKIKCGNKSRKNKSKKNQRGGK
jgi:hypothetical protein